MHYWGYVMDRLLAGGTERTTRHPRGSRRTSGRSGSDRPWSRTAPWL